MEANIDGITGERNSVMKKDAGSEDDHHEMHLGSGHEDEKRKKAAKKGSSGGGASSAKSCQVDKCSADLTDAKTYHRRHKVCEHHAKAQVVVVAGIRQRFCQQCSRFHELSEFDETKRSCRRRLAGHNERRRKNPVDNSQAGEGSGRIKGGATVGDGSAQIKDIVCGQMDDRSRSIAMSHVQENTSYKHFHVRYN